MPVVVTVGDLALLLQVGFFGAFCAGFLGRFTFEGLWYCALLLSNRLRRIRRVWWRWSEWGLR